MMNYIILTILIIFALFILCARIIRPTERGLIERFGKYNRFAEPGLNLIIPLVEHIRKDNITEKMIEAEPQEIITKDKLNASVDAQVYFKIKSDEASVKASQYNVYDCESQIVSLVRTTLRSIIGTMSLNDANSRRDTINEQLMEVLTKETKNWGIEVVRAELKEINPPKDVQETMNKVVKAENEKQAAVDYATATETQADGERRASVKRAEGMRQAAILEAQGKAEAIKIVNESAEKHFKGNAQLLRKLEVTENALKNNTKIIIPEKTSLLNVLGELSGEKK